ncbi:MAG TPA: hypothetical protein VF163_05740 [Micromonosporaceae bacterium]
MRKLFVLVASVLMWTVGLAGPASAEPGAGLEVYPSSDGRVHQYYTAGTGFYLHAHDVEVRDVKVRIDLQLSSRILVMNIPPECGRSGTVLTCSVSRIPAGQAKALYVYTEAKDGAALGPAGYMLATVLAATPSDGGYSTTSRLDLEVYTPPMADVRVVHDTTYHYLHVGDNFDALVTIRNRGPETARVLLTKPITAGFTFQKWLGCDRVIDIWCEASAIPAGATRKMGARLKLTGKTPGEPYGGFSVENVVDPYPNDNFTWFIICVYESGLCTRDLPGSASNRFSTNTATRAGAPASAPPAPTSAGPGRTAPPTSAPAYLPAPAATTTAPAEITPLRAVPAASASPLARLGIPVTVGVLLVGAVVSWALVRRRRPVLVGNRPGRSCAVDGEPDGLPSQSDGRIGTGTAD